MSGEAPRTVRYEDVDAVIGAAAEFAKADADRLTVDELKSIGTELGIPAEHVERAVAALAERRREAEALAARRRKRALVAAGVAGVFALVFGAMVTVAQGDVVARYVSVEWKRAQVRNVMDRQAHVEARLRADGAAADPSLRQAELEGAENRVAVERRRYDEAAAAYNAETRGLAAGVAARLHGLPRRVPLSNEVRSW